MQNLRLPGVFAVFSLSMSAAAQTGGPPPPIVEVATAEIRMMAPTIRVPGTILSRNDARLAAEIAGTLLHVAEIGDMAKTDDVLARIDDEQLNLEATEYAGLADRERSRIVFLEKEAERLRTLAAENNAARSRLDEVEADLAMAKSDLTVAEARLGQVRRQLRKSQVRAPFPGVVSERLHNPGERVSVGDVIVRIIDPNALEVSARAPINSLRYLAAGTAIKVIGEQQTTDGVVRTRVPYGDSRSHMVELRVSLEQNGWLVGENVELAIPAAAPVEALAVPRDALVLRRDGTSVFVIDDEGEARQIPVVAGIADGEMIAVSGPIEAGYRVVIRGGERLRAGQIVRISGQPERGSGAQPEKTSDR